MEINLLISMEIILLMEINLLISMEIILLIFIVKDFFTLPAARLQRWIHF